MQFVARSNDMQRSCLNQKNLCEPFNRRAGENLVVGSGAWILKLGSTVTDQITSRHPIKYIKYLS